MWTRQFVSPHRTTRTSSGGIDDAKRPAVGQESEPLQGSALSRDLQSPNGDAGNDKTLERAGGSRNKRSPRQAGAGRRTQPLRSHANHPFEGEANLPRASV